MHHRYIYYVSHWYYRKKSWFLYIILKQWKRKAIQTDLDTFRNNQTYAGIIQAYSEPCVTLS